MFPKISKIVHKKLWCQSLISEVCDLYGELNKEKIEEFVFTPFQSVLST
jgi:hypothetical protein